MNEMGEVSDSRQYSLNFWGLLLGAGDRPAPNICRAGSQSVHMETYLPDI